MSQGRLGELVGISVTQLSLIENSRYKPTPVTLIKLSRALGAEPAELLEPYDELD